ncbi:hypothetical protein HDZ31DRAFT_76658, partial [Schizophyllum fasciatum]
MAMHSREALPRLNIGPPSLQMQQPMSFAQGQMFSPALPTSLQQGFHPPFPMHTPMQQQFAYPMPPPSAPGRPSHHAAAASVAHLAAMGIHPPNGPPIITPVGGHFPRGSVMLGPPGMPPPFGHKRRNMSIGGPPKAVLGGPQRKTSPLPPGTSTASTSAAPVKAKKITVNLPKETIPGEDGAPSTRPPWARAPLDAPFEYKDVPIPAAEMTSAALFPPDAYRYAMPPTIDVFLPGKQNWDKLKQMAIEEKLQKLGVERGSGSNVPHIFAPHARAASISSPADPALLLFKLNKLQQAQNSSATSSPQPSFQSPSPNQVAALPPFGSRHGHSVSLAQPPTHAQNNGFNPFGPNATLGSDHISNPSDSPVIPSEPPNGILAPQGRVPLQPPRLAPPSLTSRPSSKPDFTRGFGLDIPEEAEEEEEAEREYAKEANGDAREHEEEANGASGGADYSAATTEVDVKEDRDHEGDDVIRDAPTIVAQSRLHSRHVSRLSAALSLRSVGGVAADGLQDRSGHNPDASQDMDVDDAIAEWTGSEDVYNDVDSSDDESIGEWSNPSDEERARQQRAERRIRRRAARQHDAEQPRRLPNFPRPPENTIALARVDDDIVSNPSDEEGVAKHYLGTNYYERPSSEYSAPRPLPPLPHSRGPSNHLSVHDPANAHSRHTSNEHFQPAHSQNPSASNRRELNPFAKPFVFGAPAAPPWGSEGLTLGVPSLPSAPFMGHSPLPSFGSTSQGPQIAVSESEPKPKLNAAAPEFKPLNVKAPEFKPSFSFRPPMGAPPPQTFTAPAELSRPLPVPPVVTDEAGETVYPLGGPASKKQRRQSTGSIEEGDSMLSFRFPNNLESPMSIRHDKSPSVLSKSLDQAAAEPMSFAAFSSAAAAMPQIPTAEALANEEDPEEQLNRLTEQDIVRPDSIQEQFKNFSFPQSASKPKRAPIPLDFKHPVSQNTVPAGLFKALGDERTRKTVRSRLSSRDVFEHENRPSLDDLNVPPISRKVSRTRLVTDPGNRPASLSSADDDVFTSARRHTRRRSSLPDALHDRSGSQSPVPSISSAISSPAMDLTSRLEMHRYEDRLVTEVRRAIAPIDAFEIKEQVADLVVERLNARLATRDQHMDGLAGKVREIVTSSLAPIAKATSVLAILEEGQRSLTSKQNDLTASQKHANELVSQLPQQLKAAMDGFASTLKDLQSRPSTRADPVLPDENLVAIKSMLDKLAASTASSSDATTEKVLGQQRELAEKLNALPETFASATSVLQAAHAEFALTREQNRREMDDLRKAVTEAQVQVAKARGAHGQVRVEKDVLNEKLGVVEADRNRLQEQVKTLQASATAKASEATAMEARNKELEQALATALARLKTSDVEASANKERIAALEKANRDLETDKLGMKAQIDSLQMKHTLAVRDKESAQASTKALQKRLDESQAHDEQWDTLRRACAQMSEISAMMGQTDTRELQELREELREVRDRAKVLEGEHAALKRRFKEQDGKMANAEKLAFTARQSLTQAQQRASEWERRAKEYEANLELTRTKLEHAEQTHAQLDADHSVAKLQLEEREADDRLAKDRENKLRETISALENKVRRLQTELQSVVLKAAQQPKTNGVNGHSIHRPSSRTSTVYADSRAATPTLSHAPSPTPARPSMYAPVPSRYPGVGQGAPKGRSYKNYRAASPTPSV